MMALHFIATQILVEGLLTHEHNTSKLHFQLLDKIIKDN